MRFFNTTGPIIPGDHYCIDPLRRIRIEEVEHLIETMRCFVLHAPRQTGKTTCLLALMRHLNAAGRFRCSYANVEAAQAARGSYEKGIPIIAERIAAGAQRTSGDEWPTQHLPEMIAGATPGSLVVELLSHWSAADARPLVLLLDEVDALIGDTLISLLRQLREGYATRPASFPQSVILCGVRDVRDYRIQSAGGEVITGGSAFNVKAKSLRLGDFDEGDVRELLQQHTDETGQRWTEEAIEEIWRLTRGQPWLVNAIAYEITSEDPEGRQRDRAIDVDLVTRAREALIRAREVHIDQLADKLKEPRVRRVIEPIIRGEGAEAGLAEDDVQYVIDLGLIRIEDGAPRIANALYREVIPRQLTYGAQLELGAMVTVPRFVGADGRLLFAKLMEEFQQFYRENSEHWVQRFAYREAGPQLLLQAFLQRIVNGGGRVEREYGLGRMRTDLLIVWPYSGGAQKVVVEAKVVRRSREASIAEGIVQTREYMDRCGTRDGHLVLFDARAGRTWEDRIFRDERDGITIWGM